MQTDHHAAARALPLVALLPAPPAPPPGLEEERIWRWPAPTDLARRIVASRWTDERRGTRRERAMAPAGHYVIGIAVRSAQLRFCRHGACLFDGTMPAGTLHVTAPGQPLEAEFRSPCDFIHLYVAAEHVSARHPAAQLADLLLRDALAAELARTLDAPDVAGDPLYTESVGNMILMRLLSVRPPVPRVCALPKWRLRRVLAYIEEKHCRTDHAERSCGRRRSVAHALCRAVPGGDRLPSA